MMFATPAMSLAGTPRRAGAVLLEVLLALMLFVAATAVVTTAFNSSLESIDRQKRSTQALNMAASVLAELQLGIRPSGSDGAKPFEPPFDEWTWESVVTPSETTDGTLTGLSRVEVIVRHTKSSTVQRLAQVMRLASGTSTNSTPSGPTTPSSTTSPATPAAPQI